MADDPELDLDIDPDPSPDVPADEAADDADTGVEAQADDQQQAAVADQQQVEPDRQPTRGENRFQRLSNENQRVTSELAETRRRLDELTQRINQPAIPRETPEQRAQRFALMTPQEQMQETLREAEMRQTQREQAFQSQMLDAADRTSFQARASVDPLYAKWGPKVEGRLAELRARGVNVERDVLLKFMIGEAALDRRGSKEGRREVTQARQRVAAARTRPTNSGSDTQAQRRGGQTLEQRLENVQI